MTVTYEDGVCHYRFDAVIAEKMLAMKSFLVCNADHSLPFVATL